MGGGGGGDGVLWVLFYVKGVVVLGGALGVIRGGGLESRSWG